MEWFSEAEKNLVAVVSKVATKNPDSNKVSADTETPKKNSQLQMEMKFKTDSGNFGQKEEVQTSNKLLIKNKDKFASFMEKKKPSHRYKVNEVDANSNVVVKRRSRKNQEQKLPKLLDTGQDKDSINLLHQMILFYSSVNTKYTFKVLGEKGNGFGSKRRRPYQQRQNFHRMTTPAPFETTTFPNFTPYQTEEDPGNSYTS